MRFLSWSGSSIRFIAALCIGGKRENFAGGFTSLMGIASHGSDIVPIEKSIFLHSLEKRMPGAVLLSQPFFLPSYEQVTRSPT